MFSADFIFRQQESLVDNQKCQAEFRPLSMQQNTIIPIQKDYSKRLDELFAILSLVVEFLVFNLKVLSWIRNM